MCVNDRLDLGEIIDLLSKRDLDDLVRFAFVGLTPRKCLSYRGYYEDLAIGFTEEGVLTVREFLQDLQMAVGGLFAGYKGGQYRMTRKSRVWVANYGLTSDTAITGIEDCGSPTLLRTAWMPL